MKILNRLFVNSIFKLCLVLALFAPVLSAEANYENLDQSEFVQEQGGLDDHELYEALNENYDEIFRVTNQKAGLLPAIDVLNSLGLNDCVGDPGGCISKLNNKIKAAKRGFDTEAERKLYRKYPEEKSRVFNFKRDDTEIEMTAKRRFNHEHVRGLKEAVQKVSVIPANKFSLGNGYVNVTHQVRSGVRQAIKDIFTGHEEAQRRKVAEEILNANFLTNEITSTFLLGSSNKKLLNRNKKYISRDFPVSFFDDLTSSFADIAPILNLAPVRSSSLRGLSNGYYDKETRKKIDAPVKDEIEKAKGAKGLFKLTRNILRDDFVRNITGMFSGVARALLIISLFLMIFTRLSKDGFSINFVIAQPLMIGIALWVLITNSDWLMNGLVTGLMEINQIVKAAIRETLRYNFISSPTDDLISSWKFLYGNIGYFPVLILAVVNVLAQLLIYFYLLGLILYLIIGKMVSPIWLLLMSSDVTRSHAINSFLNWIRAFLVLIFIPVLYLGIYLLGNAFGSSGNYMLNILLSMAGLVLVPVISAALLTRGGGVFSSFFSGYEVLLASLNDSFSDLKNLIEVNSAGAQVNHESAVLQLADHGYQNPEQVEDGYRANNRISNALSSFLDSVRSETVTLVSSSNSLKKTAVAYDQRLGLNEINFKKPEIAVFEEAKSGIEPSQIFKPNVNTRPIDGSLALSLDRIIKLNKLAGLTKADK